MGAQLCSCSGGADCDANPRRADMGAAWECTCDELRLSLSLSASKNLGHLPYQRAMMQHAPHCHCTLQALPRIVACRSREPSASSPSHCHRRLHHCILHFRESPASINSISENKLIVMKPVCSTSVQGLRCLLDCGEEHTWTPFIRYAGR